MPIRMSRARACIFITATSPTASGLRHVIEKVQPDEIYNLAAQSHVRVSFDQAEYTADVVATGTLRLLEAVRDYVQNTGTTDPLLPGRIVGNVRRAPPPQNETTPFYPRSPYAVSKVAAHWYAVNYREAYGLFISNGILFNHESERRGETFVTRKITRALARIKLGLQRKLFLGNLDARRDWGYAGGLRRGDVDDAAGRRAGRLRGGHGRIPFGARVSGSGRRASAGWTGRRIVETDPRYLRPTEVDYLLRRCLEDQREARLAAEGQLSRNWSA